MIRVVAGSNPVSRPISLLCIIRQHSFMTAQPAPLRGFLFVCVLLPPWLFVYNQINWGHNWGICSQMPLTKISCRNAKPKEKPYKLSDSGGMYLEVMPNGSKYWRLKYRYLGKEKRLALGVYPIVPHFSSPYHSPSTSPQYF